MSALVEDDSLVLLLGEDRLSISLPNAENVDGVREITYQALDWAAARGATDGQLNAVRKKLNEAGFYLGKPRARSVSDHARARTPQRNFRRPILRALAELGGEATVGDILDRVGELVPGLLPLDMEPVPSGGEPRWRNACKWERNGMVKEGLLAQNSSFGVWALTDLGWAAARTDEHR